MKFTLTFDGELPSTGNGSKKAQKKWDIRKEFSPQLAELVSTHPVLADAYQRGIVIPRQGPFSVEQYHHSVANVPQPPWTMDKTKYRDLCEPIEVKGRKFWPIVRESLALTCTLNILFLRKEAPGSLVLQGGDLDNRIKTLFDALKVPSADDIMDDPTVSDPMFCLLESDAMITNFTIKTDRLLSRPNTSVHEVRLVIETDVKVTQAGLYNFGYLGD